MIDEAFLPFSEIIHKLSAFDGEIMDEENGIHSYIYKFSIESPVEFDVIRNESGKLEIGTTPPVYRLATTILPSFHNIRFTAEINNDEHGNG